MIVSLTCCCLYLNRPLRFALSILFLVSRGVGRFLSTSSRGRGPVHVAHQRICKSQHQPHFFVADTIEERGNKFEQVPPDWKWLTVWLVGGRGGQFDLFVYWIIIFWFDIVSVWNVDWLFVLSLFLSLSSLPNSEQKTSIYLEMYLYQTIKGACMLTIPSWLPKLHQTLTGFRYAKCFSFFFISRYLRSYVQFFGYCSFSWKFVIGSFLHIVCVYVCI